MENKEAFIDALVESLKGIDPHTYFDVCWQIYNEEQEQLKELANK